MIRNIIFDVGDVLVSYEPEKMMKSIGFSDEQVDIVSKAMFRNPLWDAMDRGLYEKEEIHQGFLNNAPEHKELIQKAYEHIGDAIDIMPYAVDWILDMKNRGYHVYILSNYGDYTLEVTKDKLSFLPLMDGVLFSYTCKMGKPDAGIYKKLISEYFLEEEESVFIDDKLDNIQGAEKLGIKGIQFKDYKQASAELDEYLKAN